MEHGTGFLFDKNDKTDTVYDDADDGQPRDEVAVHVYGAVVVVTAQASTASPRKACAAAKTVITWHTAAAAAAAHDTALPLLGT